MERAWLVSDHKWSLGHERMHGPIAQKRFKKKKPSVENLNRSVLFGLMV